MCQQRNQHLESGEENIFCEVLDSSVSGLSRQPLAAESLLPLCSGRQAPMLTHSRGPNTTPHSHQPMVDTGVSYDIVHLARGLALCNTKKLQYPTSFCLRQYIFSAEVFANNTYKQLSPDLLQTSKPPSSKTCWRVKAQRLKTDTHTALTFQVQTSNPQTSDIRHHHQTFQHPSNRPNKHPNFQQQTSKPTNQQTVQRPNQHPNVPTNVPTSNVQLN